MCYTGFFGGSVSNGVICLNLCDFCVDLLNE